ncbi:MAG TPA: hypothetical protein VEB70_09990 [Noviherbaspirillum sp.]|nr:hypothetical protein [Noviherbaspirillum sp.]
MHELRVIRKASADAIAKTQQGEGWQAEYCPTIEPFTVAEMVRRIELLENASRLPVYELQALGKLVRDLTSFIKMRTGDGRMRSAMI